VVDASDADDEASSEEPTVDSSDEGSSREKAAVELSDEQTHSEFPQ
jgi:hypothetical protein